MFQRRVHIKLFPKLYLIVSNENLWKLVGGDGAKERSWIWYSKETVQEVPATFFSKMETEVTLTKMELELRKEVGVNVGRNARPVRDLEVAESKAHTRTLQSPLPAEVMRAPRQ